VQMMYQKEHYKYAQTDDMDLLQIPYGLDEVSMSIMSISLENGNDYGYSEVSKLTKEQLKELPQLSMLILLPKSIGDLEMMEKRLNLKTFDSYIGQMKGQEVKVYLPKFKMTCGTIELKDVLMEMGMKEAFTLADFSGVNEQKDLFISNVLHKTFVEVNEKGTEAAAASSLRMTFGLEPPPPVFRADRPFIFMIMDNKTGSILFMGRVMNPSLQS
jgi:serine protease inhibitor